MVIEDKFKQKEIKDLGLFATECLDLLEYKLKEYPLNVSACNELYKSCDQAIYDRGDLICKNLIDPYEIKNYMR